MPAADPGRIRLLEDWPALDVEVVVADVPAFGWRPVRLTATEEAHPDEVDDGDTIATDTVAVQAVADGTLTLRAGGRVFAGLGAVEDTGDRGDTYDWDPVVDGPGTELTDVTIERHRHPSGLQRLVVTRTFAVPVGLAPDRERRADDLTTVTLRTTARVAPGVDRVDLGVELDDPAADHRLRLLFPTGVPTTTFRAATTFAVATRRTALPEAHGWQHPPLPTFAHQGWIEVDGLTVAAPGLPEGEVTADGTIAVTLLRSVGHLTRMDLRTRPLPAGPGLVTPEAQCRQGITAELALSVDTTPARVHADELGMRAVPAGDQPLAAAGASLLSVGPEGLIVSALKPAEDGDGLVLRLLNPTDQPVTATVAVGLDVVATTARLDETGEAGADLTAVPVAAHGLTTLRLRPT